MEHEPLKAVEMEHKEKEKKQDLPPSHASHPATNQGESCAFHSSPSDALVDIPGPIAAQPAASMAVPKHVIWKSCCFMCDARSVVFFSALGLSLLILLFAFFKLLKTAECNEETVWVGVINFIIGAWVTPIFQRYKNT